MFFRANRCLYNFLYKYYSNFNRNSLGQCRGKVRIIIQGCLSLTSNEIERFSHLTCVLPLKILVTLRQLDRIDMILFFKECSKFISFYISTMLRMCIWSDVGTRWLQIWILTMNTYHFSDYFDLLKQCKYRWLMPPGRELYWNNKLTGYLKQPLIIGDYTFIGNTPFQTHEEDTYWLTVCSTNGHIMSLWSQSMWKYCFSRAPCSLLALC